jgi:hypothetical protein
LAKRLQDAGVARGGYAYDIANGRRIPNHRLALRIFRATGDKLGPLADVSDDAIAALIGAST